MYKVSFAACLLMITIGISEAGLTDLKENQALLKIKTDILEDQSVNLCIKEDNVDLNLLHDKLTPYISGKKENFLELVNSAFSFDDTAISRVFYHLGGGFLDGAQVISPLKTSEDITKIKLLISELLFFKAFNESSSRYDLRDVLYLSLKKISEQKKKIKATDSLSTDVESFLLSPEKDILVGDDK